MLYCTEIPILHRSVADIHAFIHKLPESQVRNMSLVLGRLAVRMLKRSLFVVQQFLPSLLTHHEFLVQNISYVN